MQLYMQYSVYKILHNCTQKLQKLSMQHKILHINTEKNCV